MRKTLLLLVAVVTLAVPAAAAASTFHVVGWEINPTPATFIGSVAHGGWWYAQVPHTPLSNTAPVYICTDSEPAPCGFFVFAIGSKTFTGAFTGGTIRFDRLVTTRDGCPDEKYRVSGDLTGDGSFNVVLRHIRKFPFLGCPIIAAKVTGRAKLS